MVRRVLWIALATACRRDAAPRPRADADGGDADGTGAGASAGQDARDGGRETGCAACPCAPADVSVALRAGSRVDGESSTPRISADGRRVAFTSSAPNLVAGDTNRRNDVFVRDLEAGTTLRVGLDEEGREFYASLALAITRDGGRVLFEAWLSPLGPAGRTERHLYLRDIEGGDTVRVDDAPEGTPEAHGGAGAAVSDDGRVVAYAGEDGRIYVRDLSSGAWEVATRGLDGGPPDAESYGPSVSADGRHVAFTSWATNLVPGDANDLADGFVFDQATSQTVRATLAWDGAEGDATAVGGGIGPQGGAFVFWSWATNLVPDDTNDVADVFVRDLEAGTTIRISVASDGTEVNGPSRYALLSTDGRSVVFTSEATNLGGGAAGLFVRDIDAGTTARVASLEEAFPCPGLFATSDGAGRVAFCTDRPLVADDVNLQNDVYVRDPSEGTTLRASLPDAGMAGIVAPDGGSVAPRIAGDRVVFATEATNLTDADPEPGPDIVVVDLCTRDATWVAPFGSLPLSRRSDGGLVSDIGSITASGSAVAWWQWGAGVYVHAFDTGETVHIARGDADIETTGAYPTGASLDVTGRRVAYSASSATGRDVFVYDLDTGEVTRIPPPPGDDSTLAYGASLSADGRRVAFRAVSNPFLDDPDPGTSDVFVHDLDAGTTDLASGDEDPSWGDPAISGDGRHVAFRGRTRAGPGVFQAEVFVRHLDEGETTRIVLGQPPPAGLPPGANVRPPSLSEDGSRVAFATAADGLVPGDADGDWDVFVHDLRTGDTVRASAPRDGGDPDGPSLEPSLSPDGCRVAFATWATNLTEPAGEGALPRVVVVPLCE